MRSTRSYKTDSERSNSSGDKAQAIEIDEDGFPVCHMSIEELLKLHWPPPQKAACAGSLSYEKGEGKELFTAVLNFPSQGNREPGRQALLTESDPYTEDE